MADSNTTLYGLVKPEVGASADSWGGKTNNDWDDVDGLLGAYTLTGSANAYVLTTGMSLAAYADKQRFCVKWNHTNSGTATLNVDGLGAKTIKKRDASTNCSASDLVSGTYAIVTYDGTNFVLLSVVASDFQASDATLTALAALSWSSGNALVQFTAADTVSLTLTPSVSSITATETTLSSNPLIGKNTADSATVRALRLEGDRATPAANDAVIASFYLSDSAGNQDEMVRLAATATAVTSGAEASRLDIYTISSGSLAARAFVSAAAIGPVSNDGIALGTATLSFSDIFLASGAVINCNNGNFTLTHVTGGMEASGFIEARVPLSSETSGTLTSASANRKVACAGNVTLNDGVFTADDFILFDPGTSARTFTRDTGATMYVNGTDSASATLAANQMGTVHWRTNAIAVLAGAFS